jgi:hypothetical protein
VEAEEKEKATMKEDNDDGYTLQRVVRGGQESMRALRAQFAKSRNGAAPSDSTISSHCVAVLALLKRTSPEQTEALGGADHLHSQWENCNAEASRNIREKYDNWSASEQQRNNFVPWEQLIAKREEIGRQQGGYASSDHVLLSFLTMLPPMRTSDYSSLRLFDEVELPRANTKRNAVMNEEWNYVHLRKTCGKLVVNEYKTANHYRRLEEARKKDSGSDVAIVGGGGGVRIEKDIVAGPMFIPKGTYDDSAARRVGDLPPDLFRVLKAINRAPRLFPPQNKSKSKKPPARGWVFLNGNGDPYTGRTFGMMVNRTMKRLFDGKAVTVNLFRHAASNWLDENHRHNRPVLLFFRHWMMHSSDMQREYVLAHNLEEEDQEERHVLVTEG